MLYNTHQMLLTLATGGAVRSNHACKWSLTYRILSVTLEKPLCVNSVLFMRSIFFSQLVTPMSSQAGSRETAPPARPNQATTFLDEVILTFSSPMAWLLVVALILTWSGVAIVLFDLLDYKTLAGNCSHLISAFNQRLISVSHLHTTLHENLVYFSLKSRVSFHFPQAFRHFWSRLQKCLHETHHNHQIILISHRFD